MKSDGLCLPTWVVLQNIGVLALDTPDPISRRDPADIGAQVRDLSIPKGQARGLALADLDPIGLEDGHGDGRRGRRGAMSVSRLEADTAKATRRLAVTLIWVFAVTVAYPYIPGSDSQAFKGISVLVGLMVSLGSAGLINQVMSGLVIAYGRALKVGAMVAVGDTLGTVSEVGMLSTKVITPKRETVTVPNAVLVGSPITNYSRPADERGAVVGTKVTIGYDAPWRQVHAMLRLAAERTSLVRKEPASFVLQRTLADFYPE